ncbi:MAG: hypothetical protein RBQ88_05135 [Desulfobulbus oligotrophicus]|jgi:hypothetical protein|uniref:Cupin domain-containing protein n=2 Tax=Desulfobulbus oligotrophicus TaxID=1909699 RepID=A0A7T5VFP2_9BACT|nr:hypothetical protein [Desulfobulbus oligotrophicus]QQG66939.1 hypothetical protein HP555_04135 [Desulfobulbus oligotrophicus]
MTLPNRLIEIFHYDSPGYRPLVDFESWRVALLNFSPDLLPGNLTRMQRHNETDEVFVLLAGRCILFVGEGDESVTRIHGVDLAPGHVHNVRRAVWHTHTLSVDAKVLIVENRDTTYDNSPFIALTQTQQQSILDLVAMFW